MRNMLSKRKLLVLALTGAATVAWAQSSPQPSILYTFTSCADGAAPNSRVTVGKGGVLYDTTQAGGAPPMPVWCIR